LAVSFVKIASISALVSPCDRISSITGLFSFTVPTTVSISMGTATTPCSTSSSNGSRPIIAISTCSLRRSEIPTPVPPPEMSNVASVCSP
jgi:hypothetical protein